MPIALVALHFIIAAIAPVAARFVGRRIFLLCGVAPLAVVVWALVAGGPVLDGEPVEAAITWVPELGLDLTFRVDAFAIVMIALVSGIGTLIFGYSLPYFAHSEHSDRELGKFAGRLVAFSGAMLGLVLADNLLVIYVFWELTSITSYLLIGFEDEKKSARSAALQAILITSAGALAMLAGLVLIGQQAGTFELSEIVADPPRTTLAGLGVLLTLAGAFTKSAQVPFHTWLPRAMAAPTPVSAYLHSATMVKAGVYLIARLAPAFAVAVDGWRPLVLGVGLATMLVGGLRALRQHDLKLLLAYGTISQLGFMITLFGAGLGEATHAAAVLLLAHAMFKATLFMVAGIVDHQAHTRDIRELSGVGARMPALAATGTVAAASMAGLPPLFGFISKESAYTTYVNAELAAPWATVMLIGLVAGSVLTFAYSWRFVYGAFATKPQADIRDCVGAGCERPPWAFLAPPAALTGLTIATGLVPLSLDHLVNAAAQSLIEVEEIHLALWHGFKPALWLSILTIALGVGMAWSAGAVEQLQERLGGWPGSQRAYDRSLEWLLVGADRLAGVVQNGSLPIYLSVILLTAVLLPGWWLVQVPTAPEPLVLAAGPVQAIVAAGVIVAAIGLATARRRFSAVLMLGAAGYGVALLFVVQGAPDLALTQFLIETLSVVIFVLVLRYLPPWFADRPWQLGRVLRLTTSVAVGLFAFFLALTSGNARLDSFTPVSQAFLERSIEEAGGHNVVNVILVDFRGLDTLGEITVLLIAALGVVALVLASRRDQGVGQHPRDLARSDEAEPRAVPSGDGARPDHEQPETETDHDRVEAER